MKYPFLFYIDRNYKFETRILELGEPDKHGKVKDIYINRVEDIGVRRGDLFRVMLETKEGGVTARRDIGKLRAVEVLGAHVTRCVIVSGAQKVVPSVEKGSSLIVVCDSQSLF